MIHTKYQVLFSLKIKKKNNTKLLSAVVIGALRVKDYKRALKTIVLPSIVFRENLSLIHRSPLTHLCRVDFYQNSKLEWSVSNSRVSV